MECTALYVPTFLDLMVHRAFGGEFTEMYVDMLVETGMELSLEVQISHASQ